jgi:parvulin-like peptidyl-prolyl isomerase
VTFHSLQSQRLSRQPERGGLYGVLFLLTLLLTGCQGRSVKEENPVFASAPPRRSLTNADADAEETRLANQSPQMTNGDVIPVVFSRDPVAPITGTTVVAQVNGKPIFADDVLGGARFRIETDPRYDENSRQKVMEVTLRAMLPKYVDDQLVVQALEQKIPLDKRNLIRDTLEPKFLELLEKIKKDKGINSDAELAEFLAKDNLTVDALRETYLRHQMVEGYLSSMIKVPEKMDRGDLLEYYQAHIADYTPDEEVRFAEIVVRFSNHGGREEAEQVMNSVVTQLRSGKDFGDVAKAMSDNLSAEKRGDMGWIKRETLADKSLEAELFELPVGELTDVKEREGRFEIYRVVDHRAPRTIPFQELQKEIEAKLLQERHDEARKQVRKELRDKANVVTMFDGMPALKAP